MRKNYYERLTAKEKLDVIGRVVDQLVRTTDTCFNLSEEEKSLIAEYAFNGVHKVLDNRYKRVLNKTRIYKLEV